ncbi:MAG TPA: hypothetical protein VJQ54_22995 [Candidatus Sulfotelmatobacter sp.]|nr:hypothetical protein [Candidatus Sulfotelmatobacter sp.]
MRRKSSKRGRAVLRFRDLDHSNATVLNSLGSVHPGAPTSLLWIPPLSGIARNPALLLEPVAAVCRQARCALAALARASAVVMASIDLSSDWSLRTLTLSGSSKQAGSKSDRSPWLGF